MSSTSSSAGNDEIRHRIRTLRVERNMTQKDLAKGKYSVSYISALERGTADISPRALRWIAGKLGISVSELQGQTALGSQDVQWIRQQLGRHAYERTTAQLLLTSGEVEEGLKRVRRLRRDADAPVDRSLVWYSAYGLVQAGNLDEARREAEEYRRLVEVTNDPRGLASLHWLLGHIALAAGDKAEAHREFSLALEAKPAEFGDPDTAQVIRRTLAAVTRALGDVSGARRIESDALHEYERFINLAQSFNWARARAEKAASNADYVTACLLIRWAWNSRREMSVHRHAAELYLRRATDTDESVSAEQREAALRRAAMLAELTGDAEMRLLAGAYLAQVQAERGALAVAEEVMRLTVPPSAPTSTDAADRAGMASGATAGGGQDVAVALGLAHAWLAAARGDGEQARRFALEVDAILENAPDLAHTGIEYPGRSLWRLFDRLGETQHAFRALRRLTRGRRLLSR